MGRKNFLISPLKESPFKAPRSPSQLTPASRQLYCFGDRPGVSWCAGSHPCTNAHTHAYTPLLFWRSPRGKVLCRLTWVLVHTHLHTHIFMDLKVEGRIWYLSVLWHLNRNIFPCMSLQVYAVICAWLMMLWLFDVYVSHQRSFAASMPQCPQHARDEHSCPIRVCPRKKSDDSFSLTSPQQRITSKALCLFVCFSQKVLKMQILRISSWWISWYLLVVP